MCNDIEVKNDLPLRGSRRDDALDMTPCSTHPAFLLSRRPAGRSNLDARVPHKNDSPRALGQDIQLLPAG